MGRNEYGYEKTTSQKVLTAVEIIVIALFAVAIIVMLSFSFLFSKEDAAPKLFGYNIYYSTVTNMTPEIPEKTAVLAKSEPEIISSLKAGDIVLCTVGDENASQNTILKIKEVQTDVDGGSYYILQSNASLPTETIRLAQKDIIARCVMTFNGLGSLIGFATSPLGILVVVVVPCLLLIALQVVHIIRARGPVDEDEYDTDDVVFSRQSASQESRRRVYDDDDEEEYEVPPVKQAFIGGEGKAGYNRQSLPNARSGEFQQSMRATSPPRIPSQQAQRTAVQRESVSSNFSQKPVSGQQRQQSQQPQRRPIDRQDYNRRDNEMANEPYYDERPRSRQQPQAEYYDKPAERANVAPRSYYEAPAARAERRLDPPAVENPVDITIPSDAAKPRHTIAPPPKQQNNKTVEDLMKMIDQAQTPRK